MLGGLRLKLINAYWLMLGPVVAFLDGGRRTSSTALVVRTSRTFEQVIEIQSHYQRMVYEAHVAELSKLGEMCAGLTRIAYKPVEQASAKAGSPNRLRSA
jgi:hypothetical protein